jgi:CopG family nickel-responsive transcriptional regulator
MKSGKTARFSVSISAELLGQFDKMIKNVANRSQAITDLIQDALVEHKTEIGNEEMAGTITLVYDHHKPHVQENLPVFSTIIRTYIISTLHVHLDHHNCLETLVIKGQASILKKIADMLISSKGVKHGKLTITTTGKDIPNFS